MRRDSQFEPDLLGRAPPVVRPARVAFSDEDIADLRQRIARTRPARFPLAGRWDFGTGREVVDATLDRWSEFDPHALAARLNAIPQIDVELDGITVRAFHLQGEIADALPIVLTHGWPSTVLELLGLADRLARPSAHGATAHESFHVVVPALPGFPLSSAPASLDDYTAARTADLWVRMMEALGYAHFAASAGDIGARVTGWLAARHPDRVLGVHVSSNALSAPPLTDDLSAAEADWLHRRTEWDRDEGGYMHIQQTRPLSLAHALSDSPAGLAAWILEKWRGWGDHADDVFDHYGEEELLGHLSLYWLTDSVASSLLPYAAHDRPPGARPAPGSVEVPVSFYLAPAENCGVPPRELAERQYPVARWTELPRGGHFLASEEPGFLADDIRAAFLGANRVV
jgi:pimeloyl-ACP methyl ester carboxylesterase